jgi:hypothetical protein
MYSVARLPIDFQIAPVKILRKGHKIGEFAFGQPIALCSSARASVAKVR